MKISDETNRQNMDNQLEAGVRLFNSGQFFECHEVLEAAWKAERGGRRLFLQALIHISVGCYHCQHGNSAGAVLQFKKGLRKLEAYLPSCEGIKTVELHRDVRAVLERIEADAVVGGYPRMQVHNE